VLVKEKVLTDFKTLIELVNINPAEMLKIMLLPRHFELLFQTEGIITSLCVRDLSNPSIF